MGGAESELGHAVAVDATGIVALAGAASSAAVDLGGGPLPGSGPDAVVASYTSSGSHRWSKRLGGSQGDSANSIAFDSSGNTLIAGDTSSAFIDLGGGPLAGDGSNSDVMLAKYASSGTHVWSKRIRADGTADVAAAISADASGNAVITGFAGGTIDFGGGPLAGPGMFVAKVAPDGSHQWSKVFSGTIGQGISVDGAGNVIVAGRTASMSVNLGGLPLTGSDANDMFLAKYTSAGAHLWSTRFGGSDSDHLRGVFATGAGTIAVTGQTSSASIDLGGGPLTGIAGNIDIVIASFSDGGTHLWSKRFDGNGVDHRADRAQGVSIDGDGNVLFIGGSASATINMGGGNLSRNGSGETILAARYSSAGAHQWSRRFGGSSVDLGRGIAAAGSGGIVFTGSVQSSSIDFGGGPLPGPGGDHDLVLVRFGDDPVLDHIVVSPSSGSIAAGGSQAFTVEGFDEDGNSLGDMTAQATFTIAPNGSCAVSSCTATVAGAHTVTATVQILSDTASLTVEPGPLSGMTLSPASSTIAAGESQAYTAEGFDAYGNSRGDVTAQATFTIAPDGSCTGSSCTATVAGAHTVTAAIGAVTAVASLTVEAGGLDHLTLSPASATIQAGGSQLYTAEGFDAHGNSLGDVTTQATFTIAPDGSCTANTCTATQAGAHTVTGAVGGASGNATLHVDPAALFSIVVTPSSSTIQAGGTQAYTVEAFDTYGNSRGDVTAQAAFVIAPDGSCTGAVCTATQTGAHTVTATVAGVTDDAVLHVAPAELASMVLDPSSATITAGGAQAYTAEGFDAHGNSLGDVTAQATFTIAPNGSCTGASCGATAAGPHTVTATIGSVVANAALQVDAGPLHHVVLSPASQTIEAGQSQAYTAEGFDVFGNSLGDVTNDASFAISPDGSCTGSSCTATVAGAHTVTGTVGAAQGTASLQVNPAPLHHITLLPADATVPAGQSQAYSVQGFDVYGNSRGDVTPQSVLTIQPNGTCGAGACSATVAGPHTVTAAVGAMTANASLEVLPAPIDRLAVTPETATIEAEQSQAYAVEGFDVYGNSHGDVTAQATLTIAPNGSCAGALCSATIAGLHTVTATIGAVTGQAFLNVVAGPLAGLSLAPATATIEAGGTQAYTAQGVDAHGNSRGDLTPQVTFAITPNGSCSANVCTATIAGPHTVRGTFDAVSGTASLTVTPGPLDRITLSPAHATRPAGVFQPYTVEGFDVYGNSRGNETSRAVLTITPDGDCHLGGCRGFAVGPHTVTAAIGAASAMATLDVVPASALSIELTLNPDTITANESDTSVAFARVRDAYGNLRLNDSVALSTDGDVRLPATMTPNGLDGYTATITASRTAGEEVITARTGAAVVHAPLLEIAGAPIRVVLEARPARVRATPSGGNTSNLAAGVTDLFGNPVPGVVVEFSVIANGSGAGLALLGPTIAPATRPTDARGEATALYTAGRLPGQDVVQAKITTPLGTAQSSAAIVVTPPEAAGTCLAVARTDPASCRFDFIGSRIDVLAADPSLATIEVDVYQIVDGRRELLVRCSGVGLCIATREVGARPDGSSLLCEVRGAGAAVVFCASRLL